MIKHEQRNQAYSIMHAFMSLWFNGHITLLLAPAFLADLLLESSLLDTALAEWFSTFLSEVVPLILKNERILIKS
jgi:hypothetical protein